MYVQFIFVIHNIYYGICAAFKNTTVLHYCTVPVSCLQIKYTPDKIRINHRFKFINLDLSSACDGRHWTKLWVQLRLFNVSVGNVHQPTGSELAAFALRGNAHVELLFAADEGHGTSPDVVLACYRHHGLIVHIDGNPVFLKSFRVQFLQAMVRQDPTRLVIERYKGNRHLDASGKEVLRRVTKVFEKRL